MALLFGEAVISMVRKSSCDNEVGLRSQESKLL